MALPRFGALVLVFSLWRPVPALALDDCETSLLQVDFRGDDAPVLDDTCHDVVEGDNMYKQCWKAMAWAKQSQVFKHPEYYHPLTSASPMSAFQKHIRFCPKPCTEYKEPKAKGKTKKVVPGVPKPAAPKAAEEAKMSESASSVYEVETTPAGEQAVFDTNLLAPAPAIPVEQVETTPAREWAAPPDLPSAPAIPTTPGCYAWMPAGCPRQAAKFGKDAFSSWRADEKGSESASKCKSRAPAFDRWCEATGAQLTFVSEEPTTPGCYAWRPLGCPDKQVDRYDVWRFERLGNESFEACQSREERVDHFCGSPGTRMKFVQAPAPVAPERAESEDSSTEVPEQKKTVEGLLVQQTEATPAREHAAPLDLIASSFAIPKKPGCYAWMPYGCPKQEARLGETTFFSWRADVTGRKSISDCKARAPDFDRWCGSTGTRMAFVSEAPMMPGCYAWMPFGCPKQQSNNFDTWHKELKGSTSFSQCEERGAVLDQWCGTKGTHMKYVQ